MFERKRVAAMGTKTGIALSNGERFTLNVGGGAVEPNGPPVQMFKRVWTFAVEVFHYGRPELINGRRCSLRA